MKVVNLVEGHNFYVDWHFKFGGENMKNPLQARIHRFPNPADIQS
jgi:hypothetical protein